MVGERLDQLKRGWACGWRKNRTSVGRLRFLAPLADVQVVARRLVEQAPHLGAGTGLAAVQQRLQTFTLGRQRVAHPLPRRRGRRRRPLSPGRRDPPELRHQATLLADQLASVRRALHRRFSRDQARELRPRNAARPSPARESTSRSRGGASRSDAALPSTTAGVRARTAIVVRTPTRQTYHGTETPAPCATVDGFGVGDGTRTG